MASIVSEREESCRCKHGCVTAARIIKWSCGCVKVEIHNDSPRGRDCTNFSAMRRQCGKSGHPGG